MNLEFAKRKIFYIPVLISLLIIAGVAYGSYRKNNQPLNYEIAIAEKADLFQSVEATGKIESINDLSLKFETGGTLDVIKVKEGDVVKAGDLLANLRLQELNAAVWQANANLQQKLAGATNQERDYYKAAVDAAKAAWDEGKIDAQNNVTVKESALETAENNLKLANGGENSQIVEEAYDDSVALLFKSVSVLDDALSQADNILGIDNTLANDDFESVLSVRDLDKLSIARTYYFSAKASKDMIKPKILSLNLASAHVDIDSALNQILDTSIKMNQLLSGVADVLGATYSGNNLTQTQLETKKATIETARGTVSVNYTNLINQKQANSDAKNSYNTFQVAYNKALRDYEDAIASAPASVASKEAAYNQAVSNWQGKTVAPREVDLAYYRAALAAAVANRDKAILKAPIDGVVAKVNGKKGETVSMSDIVAQILTPHYEIKVDIPETDVSKLKIGDLSQVTLDAFGEDQKFTGKIISIDPASTEVQDVVYYEVAVSLDDTDKSIKPGMTANVTITTEKVENALIVPTRAVRTRDDGTKYVRVLIDKTEQQKTVIVGLKGDDGKTQIVDGINEGDMIIVNIKAWK